MLTKAEILEMVPGPAMNRVVATQVMGHIVACDDVLGHLEGFTDPDGGHAWGPLQSYSEEMAAAELVVSKMIENGCPDAIQWANFGKGKYSGPEAICKAALIAAVEAYAQQVSNDILRQVFSHDA